MLTITPEQYAGFEQDARDRFLKRACAFLEKELATPVDAESVGGLFGEATGHGLRSENELVRYAIIALVASAAGDPHRGAWMRAHMGGHGSAAQRLDRLHAFAARRMARA